MGTNPSERLLSTGPINKIMIKRASMSLSHVTQYLFLRYARNVMKSLNSNTQMWEAIPFCIILHNPVMILYGDDASR